MRHGVQRAGGTCLVGVLVAARLVARNEIDVTSLVRHASAAAGRAVGYEDLCKAPEQVLRSIAAEGVDVAISCLGTTIRTAGSQPAMFRVDHDYVLAVAKGAKSLGARQLILVTAAGAGGPGFYLQTKGQIEQAITSLGHEQVDLIRPGFLIGNRNERRVWETICQSIFAALTPILPGQLSRYGAIPAEIVADAIVRRITDINSGITIIENNDLRRLSETGSCKPL
mgnify:CR=1 FL=1